jgi:DNA-binding NtrC family response regulator
MKKQQKIFIVEDNLFYANLLKTELFKKNMIDVEIFTSGEMCIQHIKKKPDVVILDHNLGNIPGLSILKKIKYINQDVQVIYLSSQKQIHVALLTIKHGAFAYVEKNTFAFRRISALINRVSKYNQKKKDAKEMRVIKFTILVVFTASIISFLASKII